MLQLGERLAPGDAGLYNAPRRRSVLWRVLAAQAGLALGASALALLLAPGVAASVLLGGLACLLPGLYMLFQHERADAPAGSGLARALKGEAGRLALTAVIFVWVFVGYAGLHFAAFLGVFAGLQLLYILAPLWDVRKRLER